MIGKYQIPLVHFGVTLDIFGLFEEAKTSQNVPKWIELVIYSTQKLRAFLELLTVESIQKFNYLELLDPSDKVEFENFEYIFRNDSLQNYKKY